MTSPVAVLIGAPGAGKSKVGRTLAAAMSLPFRDTDNDVVAEAGMPIADIFVVAGEPEFRRMETAAVARALEEHAGILAVGGGAVMDPATQAQLSGQRVVWLRVGLATAARRTGMSTARPLLLGNVRSQLNALLIARAPVYESLAGLIVDADTDDLDMKLAQIRHWLQAPPLPPAPTSDPTSGALR